MHSACLLVLRSIHYCVDAVIEGRDVEWNWPDSHNLHC